MKAFRVSFLLLAAFAATCAVTFSACSGGDPENATDTEASTTKPAPPLADAALDAALADGGVFGDRNLGVDEPYPDSLLVQNGGRIYSVVNPPGASAKAKGDGTTDDTQAFVDALDFIRDRILDATGIGACASASSMSYLAYTDTASYWIYVPNGTYLVSKPLMYDGKPMQQIHDECAVKLGPDAGTPGRDPWLDLAHLRIVGESRERTKIKLADGALATATRPTPVVAFQNPSQQFNDINADNLLKNITIDTGAGNPMAVALLMQGANVSDVRNVLLTGSGHYGLWLPIGAQQGCYSDITIDGFDYGIAQTNNGGVNGCFENVTLRNQKTAGVYVDEDSFVIRNLWADEQATGAQAAVLTGNGAGLAILDSLLAGSQGGAIAAPASGTGGALFVRNVQTTGYASPILLGDAGTAPVPGPKVSEFTSSAPVALLGTAPTSLNLPVEQAPLGVWGDPATDWANAEDYRDAGAGSPAASDEVAVQAALNSGRSVVVLGAGAYTFEKVTVPPTVQRIDGLSTRIPGGTFEVSAAASPLLLENVGSGSFKFSVVAAGARDIVLRDGNNIFRNDGPDGGYPLRLFVTNGGGGDDQADFVPANERAWARGIDVEYQPHFQYIVSGGTLWIMGYKTEGRAGVVQAKPGSQAELISGYTWLNGEPDAAMIDNDHAAVSMFATETSASSDKAGELVFQPVVQESQNKGTATAAATQFPSYPGREGKPDYLVPLYVGRP